MEPQIQYAKTSDGVDIAFASMGEGPPLVRVPLPGFSHVQRSWALAPNLYQPPTRTFRVILYDSRGTGLSDRDAIDFSMAAMMRDLEAVIDRMGLRSFALLGYETSVPIAVTYAATFPDRVTHLVLVNGRISRSDFVDSPGRRAHEALLDTDWTLYTETMTRVLLGIDDPQLIESLGEHMRACIEQEVWRVFTETVRSYDVSALLADVRAETLVLHNNNNPWAPVRVGQKLAAGIPDARFLAIDDMTYQSEGPLIEEFVGLAAKDRSVEPSAFRTVLFTDLVGHTEMMSRLGDERGRDVLREHERIVREALAEHSGTEVKTMGDGFMASFGSVTKAVECAIALQRAFAERESDEPLSVRVGLNAGEPIEEDGDLFGATVILASRIAAKAEGGEILVADTVRGLCSGKGFLFADRGEVELRGFEDPVRVYEVRWTD
ncbi:MAG: adenylate/guanylate cyclase domain-containing protein [Chloroflexi bacterium]|nr:adenylate/guanylate cyclase domain-containing protein [Chloroflexota bacterium]